MEAPQWREDGAREREMSGAPSKSLWTAGDVASFLSVSTRWVYERAARGDLPCVRFGGHVRFEPNAVRGYLRGNVVARQADALLDAPSGTGRGRGGRSE